MADIITFQEEYPSIDSYWRSVILFGRNVASYKFALAKSLLEIVETGKTIITLEDLAVPFSKNLCEHIANSPKQATCKSSKFLDACKQYNSGIIEHDQLINITVQLGFNNVLDAFHTVNFKKVPVKFFEKDFSYGRKRIILTDSIFKLQEVAFFDNFMYEAEARWNLVETSWELCISRNLLSIEYDENKRILFAQDNYRRKDVTSARDSLNGFQKGKCFYCFDDITVDSENENCCDVDHFFPYVLQPLMPHINLNGIWNLVLACPRCNRGTNGKFARVPNIKYLQRLENRNEFLVISHHPLRETLISQTGRTPEQRHAFLASVDKEAINFLVHRWCTKQIGEEVF